MIRKYCFAIACVGVSYLMTLIGYLPAIEIHETSIVSVFQQILEIGDYKLIALASASFVISEGFPSGTSLSCRSKMKYLIANNLRSGVCAVFGFAIILLPMSLFLPMITTDEIEMITENAPHWSVYTSCNVLVFLAFHGILLFNSGVLLSSIFMIPFCRKNDKIQAFLLSLLIYQSVTFIQSLCTIPAKWKLSNLFSGWFQIGENTPVADALWSLLVVCSLCFLINILSAVCFRRKDKE